jgi:elongation factor P--(R)-beta-lysine ligase
VELLHKAYSMNKKRLLAQFHLLEAIRQFFRQEKFIDVLTPPLVPNPGMEAHIHPFAVSRARQGESTGLYLHTSPEFAMKQLLTEGHVKIFTLNYVFRDEPQSPIHRPQFIMLEWYRAGENYRRIMKDCENLYNFCRQYLKKKKIPLRDSGNKKIKFRRLTVQQLFKKYLKIDILQFLNLEDLRQLIAQNFSDIPLPQEGCSWDDYYFLLFLNKIEPHLTDIPHLIIDQFPYHLNALSTINRKDPRVCDRFEVYLHGLEVGNCFNELTELQEQQKRFVTQNSIKEKLYRYRLPEPQVLYRSLSRGLPPSCGIAIGVERLLLSLTGGSDIFWT